MKLAKLKTLEAVKRERERGSFRGYIEWNRRLRNMRTHGTCMSF